MTPALAVSKSGSLLANSLHCLLILGLYYFLNSQHQLPCSEHLLLNHSAWNLSIFVRVLPLVVGTVGKTLLDKCLLECSSQASFATRLLDGVMHLGQTEQEGEVQLLRQVGDRQVSTDTWISW